MVSHQCECCDVAVSIKENKLVTRKFSLIKSDLISKPQQNQVIIYLP